jgi:hypothetical protein
VSLKFVWVEATWLVWPQANKTSASREATVSFFISLIFDKGHKVIFVLTPDCQGIVTT